MARSNLWYILPILTGIIGSVISYYALKYDDNSKAKKCLFVGIGAEAVWVTILLWVLLE